MVVLAMSAAVLLRGGELLTAEAAVSAILLVSLDPSASDVSFTLNRIFEGADRRRRRAGRDLAGLPARPGAARRARGAGGVRRARRRAGAARDRARPRRRRSSPREALAEARGLDTLVAASSTRRCATGRETARLSPRRRAALAALDRYAESFTEVDFAIRDTRVLARHSVRLLRARRAGARRRCRTRSASSASRSGRWRAPTTSPSAPTRSAAHALRAGSLAGRRAPTEVLAQIRSTAVDLRRAADLTLDPGVERPRGANRGAARHGVITVGGVRRLTLAIAAALIVASPAHADWNGDGPGDVLAVHPDGRLLLYAGNGAGGWAPPVRRPIGGAGWGGVQRRCWRPATSAATASPTCWCVTRRGSC